MGKASRSKRRAPVRAAKRAKTNTVWYAMTAVVVVLGVALIVMNRPTGAGTGPIPGEDHWHAALGVYVCDHWATDPNPDPSTGQPLPEGTWIWPGLTTNSQGGGVIGRVGTVQYAGLHSHVDGIIHMEPSTTDESGKNATVGKYFKFGGWKLDSDSFEFLGEQRKNGDMCGEEPGTLQWALNGNVQTGNPASYKLFNDDEVVIAFVPEGADLKKIASELPVIKNLAGATGREENNGVPEDTPLLTVPVTPSSEGTPTSDTGPPASDGTPTSDAATATTTADTPTSAP